MAGSNQPPKSLREYADIHRNALATLELRGLASARSALAGTAARNAFSTTSMAAEMLKDFEGQQRRMRELLKPMHDLRRFAGLDNELFQTVTRAAAQIRAQADAALRMNNAIAPTLARVAQEQADFSRRIAEIARPFEGLQQQWKVPSVLMDSFATLRAADALLAGLRLPVIDLAAAAAISAAWGPEGIERQLRNLGIDPGTFGIEVDSANAGLTFVVSSNQVGGRRWPDVYTLLGLLLAILVPLYQEWSSAQMEARLTGRIADLDQAHARQERQLQALEELLRQVIEQQVFIASDCYVVRRRPALIRERPESGSAVLSSVFPNQLVNVTQVQGKWIHVEYYDWLAQEDRIGWALKKYFSRVRSCAGPAALPDKRSRGVLPIAD